jgi:hypothetical protein
MIERLKHAVVLSLLECGVAVIREGVLWVQ